MPENQDHSHYEPTSIGEGVGFERIRRITGYLTGSLEKWNDAKRAEEAERVKHGLNERRDTDESQSDR